MTSPGGVSFDLVSSRAATVRAIPPLSPAEPLRQRRRKTLRTSHGTVTPCCLLGNRSRGVVSRALTLALAAGLLLAAPAAGKTPLAGWTAAKAEAQVKAKVKLPWCRALNQPTGPCVGTLPAIHDAVSGPFAPRNVACRGTTKAAGGYSVFVCDWSGNNGFGRGRLEVFVTGPLTFRWKSV